MTPAEKARAEVTQVIDAIRDEFLQRDVTITGENGETRFAIGKMKASKGWDVLEEIREAANQPIADNAAIGGARDAMEAIVMALPRPFTRRLRDTMFAHVTFTNRVAVSGLPLAGAEETAFDAIDAEPVAIYEIFLRSLAVNFTPSFVELLEKIFRIESLISSRLGTETSPPSSPPP